jgi:hypothetical protein
MSQRGRFRASLDSVDYLLVGVVGGLQPDKLARSFKGDLDGMYARVLFSWPAEPPYLPLTNEVAEVEPEIVNALTRIINLVDEKEDTFAPRNISLSPKAVEVFELFRQFQHNEKKALEGSRRRRRQRIDYTPGGGEIFEINS